MPPNYNELPEPKINQQEIKKEKNPIKSLLLQEDDTLNNREIDDVRKQRLTLKHINRLRKQRELHNIEHATRVERIKKIYAKPPAQ